MLVCEYACPLLLISDVKVEDVGNTSPAGSGITLQELSSVSPLWTPAPFPQSNLHIMHIQHKYINKEEVYRSGPVDKSQPNTNAYERYTVDSTSAEIKKSFVHMLQIKYL